MNGKTQSSLFRRRERCFWQYTFLSLLMVAGGLIAQAQHLRPGRGATSAQDIEKLAALATANSGSDAADQVCARFSTGSVVSAPPELKSQNGVLEVTMKFLTVTDSQGLARFCYVTDAGVEAPTLRVNPGDQLIIHFQNDLPAASATTGSAAMAGMKMTLSSDVGCGGTTKMDPGTATGTYTIVVTGTAGSGSAQYQTSVNVPITIQ